MAVATSPAAAASKSLAYLLALLITPHLSTGKFLNDVFDSDLLGLSALKSLLNRAHLAGATLFKLNLKGYRSSVCNTELSKLFSSLSDLQELVSSFGSSLANLGLKALHLSLH